MCQECGCGIVESYQVLAMQNTPKRRARLLDPSAADANHSPRHAHHHDHDLHHDHTHGDGSHLHHHHEHSGEEHRTISVLESLRANNDRLAERNRGFFKGKGIMAINLVSSPGSGKTLLIEKTLEALKSNGRSEVAVIVGDLETANDACRIRDRGAPVVQITTGAVCHLDAEMVARGIDQLELDGAWLMVIENVGNLVCPAAFDLGEDLRVVMMSTTEGEDKPLKYAPMFRTADAVLINKIDIADAVGFARQSALGNIGRSAPKAEIIELSAKTGEGMTAWLDFLKRSKKRLLRLE